MVKVLSQSSMNERVLSDYFLEGTLKISGCWAVEESRYFNKRYGFHIMMAYSTDLFASSLSPGTPCEL